MCSIWRQEYILLAVQNIRDNLGESAVTEKDLMRFRRSVIQRVALQYFAKDELKGHDHTDSDNCENYGATGIVETHHVPGDSAQVRVVHSSPRVKTKRSKDSNRSLHRQVVEHTWGARLENGFQSANGCTLFPGLSPTVSDGPDSLLGDMNHALQDEKNPLDESNTQPTSLVSSPATSDRLRLASLKVPPVMGNDVPGSIPVSSRSTSPHTPSSASSCSTLGYFFGSVSHSEDDDRPDNGHLPPPPPTGTSSTFVNDLSCRRRSKRSARRTGWWNWGSTRRSRPKRSRQEHLSKSESTNNISTSKRAPRSNQESAVVCCLFCRHTTY
ncbi:unnamed protein product [Echinostoma caproni]|uniref:DNTTIP1_dimer domain-containing protein n=1 Tax=Echinostoma caproni TaxID=27848 RepID=A0A183B3I1_9TREM|nr:unnamed protein product [Echinostoma caproni]